MKVRAVPTKKRRRVGIRERVRVREVRAIGRGMMRIVIGRRRRDWEVEKMEGERAREVGLEMTCLVCILCCLLFWLNSVLFYRLNVMTLFMIVD